VRRSVSPNTGLLLFLPGPNRNAEGDDSLEAAINRLGTPQSLPVLTIADPDWLMKDRDYAERAAVQLLESLMALDNLRSAGRFW